MPNFKLKHLLHISSNVDKKLADDMQDMQNAINQLAQQVNANPIGTKVDAPPNISSVKVEQFAPGVAKVTAIDNNPVQRGIVYHFEASTTPDFQVGTTVLSGTHPSRVHLAPVGGGALHWRSYSQYPTSDPSTPVAASASFDAGGSARTGDLTGTGSGTEPSVQPQPGAGFGFSSNRKLSAE